MITGTTAQANNSIIEKYCYNNDEANCTTYGALYQWDEAMQYGTTEKAKGICPANSHIPSDNDWKILEVQLGMTQAQVDATNWRGTDQGAQLKPGGTSGLSISLAGFRDTGGGFINVGSYVYSWSSTESSTSAWYRSLVTIYATMLRYTNSKGYGFSIRCLGD